MNRYLLGGIIILIALIGFYLTSVNRNSSSSDSLPLKSVSEKSFTITGSNFKFDPSRIEVNRGDKVKLTFVDNQGFHDLVVDGYNVAVKPISQGNQTSLEFTADKAGTFQYYCSIDGHREQGMVGTLVVN